MPTTRSATRRKLNQASKLKKRTKQSKAFSKKTKRPKVERPSGEDDEDKILKTFDLDMKFGACIGISRLERWERAKKFGLDPPTEIKKILTKYDEHDPKNKCLWTDRV
eukprot:g1652.t1